MWELIRANKLKSVVLIVVMGLMLSALGYLIAMVWVGEHAGLAGVAAAMMLWAILALVSIYGGDRILIGMSGARKIDRSVHPRLWNVVEEMKIAAGLPAMPDIYIIPTRALNAYATGMKPEKCAVVVTAGLVENLSRDELQGVIAHEMAHILNRDLLFMTLASVFVGSVVIISQVFLRGTWLGAGRGGGRSRRSGSGGGGGHAVILIIALLAAILAPIMVRLMYFAVSRRREYLADATAARLTRYPEGLASALEKIAGDIAPLEKDNQVLTPLYIVNPGKKGLSLTSATSTHPATSERIAILRSLGAGCQYGAYQRAYNAVRGKKGGLLPGSALKESQSVPLRQPSSDAPMDGAQAARAAGDLAYAVGQYAFIACACGLRIKIPPEYKAKTLSCPRCGREHQTPIADLANVAGMLTALSAAKQQAQEQQAATRAPLTANGPTEDGRDLPPMKHRRSQTREWETFNCSCGNPMQLSPYFRGDHMTCSRCCRRIDIVDA